MTKPIHSIKNKNNQNNNQQPKKTQTTKTTLCVSTGMSVSRQNRTDASSSSKPERKMAAAEGPARTSTTCMHMPYAVLVMQSIDIFNRSGYFFKCDGSLAMRSQPKKVRGQGPTFLTKRFGSKLKSPISMALLPFASRVRIGKIVESCSLRKAMLSRLCDRYKVMA